MAVRATELRKGTVIIGERGELLLITEYNHHTPGNLRAVIHMKVKNIQTGATMPMRLGSSDSFEVMRRLYTLPIVMLRTDICTNEAMRGGVLSSKSETTQMSLL